MGIDTKLILIAGIRLDKYAQYVEKRVEYVRHDARTGQPTNQKLWDDADYWQLGDRQFPASNWLSPQGLKDLAEQYGLSLWGDNDCVGLVLGVALEQTDMRRSNNPHILPLSNSPDYDYADRAVQAYRDIERLLAACGAKLDWRDTSLFAYVEVSA